MLGVTHCPFWSIGVACGAVAFFPWRRATRCSGDSAAHLALVASEKMARHLMLF
jgi:hypothetical protein